MVQQVESYPVELTGPGFTVNSSGDYRPGEYKRLHNVELVNNRLTNRRDIRSTSKLYDENSHIFGANSKFIGLFNDYAVYTGPTSQYAVNSNGTTTPMWNPVDFFTSTYGWYTNGTQFHRVVGVFKYNHRNYWIEYFSVDNTVSATDDQVGIKLWSCPDTVSDLPEDYTTAMLTAPINQINITPDSADPNKDLFNNFSFNNFFLHKDRLWIITPERIYYSVEGLPTDFTVGNGGGFIDLTPGSFINYAFALNDDIFIIADDSIHVFNYTINPNDLGDASLNKITDSFGGQHGCVFRNVPFFLNKEGIYRIDSQYVTKILDNNFDTGENNYTIQKLTPYREYLIVSKAYSFNEINFTSNLSLSRTNLARNADFEFSYKAPPFVQRSEWEPQEGVLEYILGFIPGSDFFHSGLFFDWVNNKLYVQFSSVTNAFVIHIKRFNVTFDYNRNITSILIDNTFNSNAGYFNVPKNVGAYMQGDSTRTLTILHPGNAFCVFDNGESYYFTLFVKNNANNTYGWVFIYIPIDLSFAYGAYISNFTFDVTGALLPIPCLVYDRYTGNFLIAHNSTKSTRSTNIQIFDGNMLFTGNYYSVSSPILSYFGPEAVDPGDADNTNVNYSAWYFDTISYKGNDCIVMANATNLLIFRKVITTSSTAFSAVTIDFNKSITGYLYKNPLSSHLNYTEPYPNVAGALAPGGFSGPDSKDIFLKAGNTLYRSSRMNVDSINNLYCIVFYGTDVLWDSYSKSTGTLDGKGFLHLRPFTIPVGCTKYSMYVSLDKNNWYPVQVNLTSPESYYWDGAVPFDRATGVALTSVSGASLPIPVSAAQYDNSEGISNFGREVDTRAVNLSSAYGVQKIYAADGVLSSYQISDFNNISKNGSYYCLKSDGYDVAGSASPYGRIQLTAGKTYTFSYKIRASTPVYSGWKTSLNILAYADNSTLVSNSSYFTYTNIVDPELGTNWVTVIRTISVNTTCYVACNFNIYNVLTTVGIDALFTTPSYESCIQFSERLIEESNTVGTFFSGNLYSLSTNIVFKYLTTPNHYSSSGLYFYKGINRKLSFPIYDVGRANQANNEYKTNLIFINMDESSVHSVGIDDMPSAYNFKIVDVIYNPETNKSTGYPSLYFMASSPVIPNLYYANDVYCMDYEYSLRPSDLLARNFTNTERAMPVYIVDFDSITTGDQEFTVKKFRNIELMAKIPNNFMRMYIAYDDGEYTPIVSGPNISSIRKSIILKDKLVSNQNRPHFSHRVGLNQRARSISIKFTNEVTDMSTLVASVYDKFEISSIRLLWSPTQRGPLSPNNL